VLLLVLPQTKIWNASNSPLQSADSTAMAAYFFMWGLFTLIMFFGTLKTNLALQFVFISLVVLFFLLTAKELTASTDLGIIAGYEGIICGLSAFYLAIAEVLNEIYGKTLLPV